MLPKKKKKSANPCHIEYILHCIWGNPTNLRGIRKQTMQTGRKDQQSKIILDDKKKKKKKLTWGCVRRIYRNVTSWNPIWKTWFCHWGHCRLTGFMLCLFSGSSSSFFFLFFANISASCLYTCVKFNQQGCFPHLFPLKPRRPDKVLTWLATVQWDWNPNNQQLQYKGRSADWHSESLSENCCL